MQRDGWFYMGPANANVSGFSMSSGLRSKDCWPCQSDLELYTSASAQGSHRHTGAHCGPFCCCFAQVFVALSSLAASFKTEVLGDKTYSPEARVLPAALVCPGRDVTVNSDSTRMARRV